MADRHPRMRYLSRERLPRWHPKRLGRWRLDLDRERPDARPVIEAVEDGWVAKGGIPAESSTGSPALLKCECYQWRYTDSRTWNIRILPPNRFKIRIAMRF